MGVQPRCKVGLDGPGRQCRSAARSLAHGAMPRPVLTDEQKEAARVAASTELAYLLARQGVAEGNQLLFYHAGVTTIEKFASLAKDRDDLLQVLRDHWELDQGQGLEERVQVASIVCAQQASQTRVKKAAEVEAEFDVQNAAKPLVSTEWSSLREALDKRLGVLEDRVIPAKDYVEKKLADVEAGEYRAEPLTEVVSKDEVDPDAMVPVWDARGRFTMRRSASKVPEPANAEQLRRRMSIMKNAFVMISLRHTNRQELQGEWERTFEEYKDYLLGEYVYMLAAKDADGNTIATANLVLSYEHAVRKKAVKLVNSEGLAFPVALKQSWKDPTVKERCFTTPLALYAKRPTAGAEWEVRKTYKGDKGDKGFKGKGKGGKGGKSNLQHCASHTPEGKPVCYRFNNPKEKCKAAKCKFEHVCGLCFSPKHPMHACGEKTRQEQDTQGTA